jgi:hypothetical protein
LYAREQELEREQELAQKLWEQKLWELWKRELWD